MTVDMHGLLMIAVMGFTIGLEAAIPPAIEWQSLVGGSQADKLFAALPIPSGGYLVGGNSFSPLSGNKSSTNYGQMDFWLIRMDDAGQKVWDAAYGGNSTDSLITILPTAAGNFLLCGNSYSETGDVRTASHYGFSDFWTVLVDANGLKLWDRAYGGTTDEFLQAALSVPGGGYLLGGYSYSSTNNGTKTAPNRGNSDFWLVHVDANGMQQWDRTYGGMGYDNLHAMIPWVNGGYLLVGDSNSSTNNDKMAPIHGGSDYWVVAVDANGNKVWDKSYGGTGTDYACAIVATADGGFLLGGLSNSEVGGTKTTPGHGGFDYWIVCIDADGRQLWDRTFGGTQDDSLQSLLPLADVGFLLAGASASSTNGNKTAVYRGGSWGDFWCVRIDAQGNRIWDESYGGLGSDALYTTCAAQDGGFLLAGWSDSPASGNKNGNSLGMSDFWIIKLAPEQWVPRISLGTPGLVANGFQFNCLNGGSARVKVEYSTNLIAGWIGLQTNTLSGSNSSIQIPFHASESQRYFRLQVLP